MNKFLKKGALVSSKTLLITMVFIVTFSIAIAVNIFTANIIADFAFDQKISKVPTNVWKSFSSLLNKDDLENWESEDTKLKFSAFTDQLHLTENFLKINIVDTDGRLLWAELDSEKSDIGTIQEETDILITTKEILFEESDPDHVLPLGLSEKEVSEMYIPILDDQNETIAIINTYFDQRELLALQNRFQLIIWLVSVIAGLMVSIMLFTIFKSHNKDIKSNNNKINAIIDNTPNAVFMVDKKGKIEFINTAAVHYSKIESFEQAIGKSIFSIFKTPEAQSLIKKGLSGEKSKKPLYSLFDKRSKKCCFRVETIPIHLDDQQVDHLIVLVTDISDQKAFEEESISKSKELEEQIIESSTELKAQAEALKESEAKFRTIITTSEAIIFMVSDNGVFLLLEGKGLQLLNLEPGELVGASAFEIYHDKPEIVEGIKQAVGGNVYRGTVEINKHTFTIFFSPYKNSAGVIVGAMGMAVDISDRVIAENSLKSSEKRFREFFENEPEYSYIVSPKGIIQDVNLAAIRALGYTKEELVGKPLNFTYSPTTINKMKTVCEKWKTVGKIENEEMVILTKKGKEKTVLLSAVLVYDDAGNIQYSISVQKDITKIKESEKALQNSEERLRSVIETASNAIISADSKGKIVSWNKAAENIFGYNKDEILGKAFKKIFPKKSDFAHYDKKSFAENGLSKLIGKTIESQGLRKNQEQFEAEVSLAIWQTDNEKHITAMINDISERKAKEAKEKEFDTLKSRFITALTHVTRTPLNAIRWNLESVLSGDFGKIEKGQEIFLKNALESEGLILRLIRNMNLTLDIERNTLTLQKTSTSLDSLVLSVVKSFHPTISLKDLKHKHSQPKKPIPSIKIDAEKIRQSLEMIVDNAIRYSQEKGVVSTKIAIVKNSVRISITDSGVGIPTPEQNHIFNRFFRASNAQSMHPNGIGLGLYIAKAIIEKHGGEIGFSCKENKGCTFWFDLPI